MSKKFQQNNITRMKIAKKLDTIVQDYRSLQWLTSDEVCKLFDISPQALAQYRIRKQIPYSKIGNKCFYTVQDLGKLLYDNLQNDER